MTPHGSDHCHRAWTKGTVADLIDPQAAHDASSSTGRILSGAAMFVALASLVLSMYEARMTREHDKLSVWPSVTTFNSDSGDVYTFNVQNVGIGPAVIRS